jgi:putative transposase
MSRKRHDPAFKAKVAGEALKGIKTLSELSAEYGVHPVQISAWKKKLVDNMTDIFATKADKTSQDAEKEKAELYRQIGQLKVENDWMKKKLSSSTYERRVEVLDWKCSHLSMRRQCKLLGLCRSSLYREKAPESNESHILMQKFDRIFTEHPYFGVDRMTRELRKVGYVVNPKRTRRLMRKMDLVSVLPRPYTSHPRQDYGFKKHPYRLRGLAITRLNQVWCTDITYIPLRQGFVYLVAILDWYSRKVLSYRISNTLDSRFCVEALLEAIQRWGRPEIFNSDQGCQFTSDVFTGILEAEGIAISWDGRGRAVDNIIVERFWWTLKYEHVYIHEADTMWQAEKGISKYISWYNSERTHMSLGNKTPDSIYHFQPAALVA